MLDLRHCSLRLSVAIKRIYVECCCPRSSHPPEQLVVVNDVESADDCKDGNKPEERNDGNDGGEELQAA